MANATTKGQYNAYAIMYAKRKAIHMKRIAQGIIDGTLEVSNIDITRNEDGIEISTMRGYDHNYNEFTITLSEDD